MKRIFFILLLLIVISFSGYIFYKHNYPIKTLTQKTKDSLTLVPQNFPPDKPLRSEVINMNLKKLRKALIDNNEAIVQSFIEYPINTREYSYWVYHEGKIKNGDETDFRLTKADYQINRNKIFSEIFKKLLKTVDFDKLRTITNIQSPVIEGSDGNIYSLETMNETINSVPDVQGIGFILLNESYDEDSEKDQETDTLRNISGNLIKKNFRKAEYFFHADWDGNLKLTSIDIQ